MKAIWNGTVIAESGDTVVVEGNHYFSPDSVKTEYLEKSGETYECPWKGHADYYNVTAGGVTSKGGAWTYPEPKEAAKEIASRFAFWKGINVTE